MNSEISMGDLASLIASLMNEKISFKTEEKRIRPKNSEVERLICDNKNLINNTNWSPKYTLKKGIKEVIKWMKDLNNFSSYKIGKYNV